jgi:hypothetical protein
MTRSFAFNASQPKMRFALKPVKLQFDNVRRFPAAARDPGVAGPHLNRRQTHYIGSNCAVSKDPAGTPIAAPRNIDENGTLPYKPRQLSAMARLDRGGSFGPETARFGPVSIGGPISITGKLPGQRRTTREADLSTQ